MFALVLDIPPPRSVLTDRQAMFDATSMFNIPSAKLCLSVGMPCPPPTFRESQHLNIELALNFVLSVHAQM